MKSGIQRRDVAKFFAGWAAAETIGHWALGILGTDLFPITIGRFVFTADWNLFAMAAWPLILAALAYVGWCCEESRSLPPTHSAA